MSDERDDLAAIDGAARGLVPELARRLREHGRGEIEVRRGSLRVGMKASAATAEGAAAAVAQPDAATASGQPAAPSADGTSPPDERPTRQPVSSPAVGVFVYADGLGPGLAVAPGQTIGRVDMLGVHYDVRAHRAGTVATLATESGDPVEYGQLLVEIEEAPPK